MRFRIADTLDEYFEAANETTDELLASSFSLMAAIRTYYSFFGTGPFARENAMSPIQAPSAVHVFLLYVRAIRVALSGNSAATFPPLRAALESSCYAFLMGEEAASSRGHRLQNRTNERLRAADLRCPPDLIHARLAVVASIA